MSGKILVTGANGFLGSHLIGRYAETSKAEIIAVWQSNKNRFLTPPPAHIHYEQCNLSDRIAVQALFSSWNISRVFHSAALLPDGGSDFLHRAVLANVNATANLVEGAFEARCSRFVYCSSISVYDGVYDAIQCGEDGWDEGIEIRPSTVYGWTKYAGEEVVRLFSKSGGLTGVSLRLAGIHGPGREGGAVYHMMSAARTGTPLKVNYPKNRFQLLFVEDAVQAAVAALQRPMPKPYQPINVASHLIPSLEQLAARIVAVCGSRSDIESLDVKPVQERVMNISNMAKLLGVEPASLDLRLHQMLIYLNNRDGRHV